MTIWCRLLPMYVLISPWLVNERFMTRFSRRNEHDWGILMLFTPCLYSRQARSLAAGGQSLQHDSQRCRACRLGS